MSDTKEKILTVALSLFAQNGYEAVSVSDIAAQLGITKGALYKHYRNKRDIFDSIVRRMSDADYERAKEYEMPEDVMSESLEAYQHTSAEEIRVYSKAQFRYWTEDSFASDFRKMLTLEQYRDPEAANLHQQYLAGGPLRYMADIFGELTGNMSDAMQTALAFYAPFFLLYNMYDAAEDKSKVLTLLDRHVDRFLDRLVTKP